MRTLLYTPTPTAKARSLQRVLIQCGVHVDLCEDAERFMYRAMTDRYAAVIVQEPREGIGLLELHAEWKRSGCTGMFVAVSALQSAFRRGQALAAGIDLYYIEPFSHTSLAQAVVLRAYAQAGQERAVHATRHFELDVLRRSVSFAGMAIDFTKTEFEIFALLVRRKGAVLSRTQIWEEVWGYADYPLANTIDVHLNRLRKKLPQEARRFLGTVYGIGYRLSAEA